MGIKEGTKNGHKKWHVSQGIRTDDLGPRLLVPLHTMVNPLTKHYCDVNDVGIQIVEINVSRAYLAAPPLPRHMCLPSVQLVGAEEGGAAFLWTRFASR